ncbi:cation efflux system CusB domain protein [Shigella dysenteriae 225-75]|nr:cation efflux system CusB domain protein [Shigella dysenteriae 225-75]
MPCFTAMRAEIALMSGSAFAVTHHAFSSGAGRTSDGNGSHASTLKSPSYTKSVSWQHYPQNVKSYSGTTRCTPIRGSINQVNRRLWIWIWCRNMPMKRVLRLVCALTRLRRRIWG